MPAGRISQICSWVVTFFIRAQSRSFAVHFPRWNLREPEPLSQPIRERLRLPLVPPVGQFLAASAPKLQRRRVGVGDTALVAVMRHDLNGQVLDFRESHTHQRLAATRLRQVESSCSFVQGQVVFPRMKLPLLPAIRARARSHHQEQYCGCNPKRRVKAQRKHKNHNAEKG
jgi:hypothetical protein